MARLFVLVGWLGEGGAVVSFCARAVLASVLEGAMHPAMVFGLPARSCWVGPAVATYRKAWRPRGAHATAAPSPQNPQPGGAGAT